jgi:hypothetical protein
MDKSIIAANRKRKLSGSFGWMEHRFIREGYIKVLTKQEILLYFFLALVSDKNGISFYGADRAMSLLKLEESAYFGALSGLEQKDFIYRQGNKVQLLSLPEYETRTPVIGQGRFEKTLSVAEILKRAGHGQE